MRCDLSPGISSIIEDTGDIRVNDHTQLPKGFRGKHRPSQKVELGCSYHIRPLHYASPSPAAYQTLHESRSFFMPHRTDESKANSSRAGFVSELPQYVRQRHSFVTQRNSLKAGHSRRCTARARHSRPTVRFQSRESEHNSDRQHGETGKLGNTLAGV